MVLLSSDSVLVRVFYQPLLKKADCNIGDIDSHSPAYQFNALGLVKGNEFHLVFS